MATQCVFYEPLSVSQKLCHLVQGQLTKASRTNTLDDLTTMIETLSTITSTCESVLADISRRGQESDAFTAVEEIENVLTWDNFLNTMKTTASDPDFLFRAHKHVGSSQPKFVPDLDVPFDLEYRRTYSIDDFARRLALHLSKTKKKEEMGEKIETCFLSTSSNLEWTIHVAGQKWRDRSYNTDEAVGLAIFDVKKLRQTTTIFHVTDIFKFLENEGKGQLIGRDLQKWARNCDEYVSMGRIHDNGLVRWVMWEEIYRSPARILSVSFAEAYTLGIYRQWMREIPKQHIELENICQRFVEFGQVLAGPQDDLIFPLIELILKQGVLFWGFETESSEDTIRAKIHALVDEMALQKLSGLSI